MTLAGQAFGAVPQDFADCQQADDIGRSVSACSNIISDQSQADGDRATAYHYRGNDRAARDAFDGAISDYDQALRLDPNNAEIWASRAIAEMRKGDSDAAVEDYRRAHAIDSTKIDAAASVNPQLKLVADAAVNADQVPLLLDQMAKLFNFDPDHPMGPYPAEAPQQQRTKAAEFYRKAQQATRDEDWAQASRFAQQSLQSYIALMVVDGGDAREDDQKMMKLCGVLIANASYHLPGGIAYRSK